MNHYHRTGEESSIARIQNGVSRSRDVGWFVSRHVKIVALSCSIKAYGSVSAGRGKCLFNVLFFKVKAPCDQT